MSFLDQVHPEELEGMEMALLLEAEEKFIQDWWDEYMQA